MQEFDIAIIGGGLVGAAFARAIAGFGLQTVLIDQACAEQLYHSSLDNRGLALAHSTSKYLIDLNVWDKLAKSAYPIKQVHVSQQSSFGFTKLSAKQAQLPQLGFVLSAAQLGKALIQDLEQLEHLTILRPVALLGANFLDPITGWELSTKSHRIKARMLIAADGTNSLLRKILGIGVHTKDFAQSALVTNVSINKTHADIAYERFANDGVLALLPFGHQQLKCVFTANNTKAQELLSLPDKEFLKILQQTIGYRAGIFTNVTARKIFPIITACIDRIYAQNVFFIGNAANTLHPVAAQGFNLGVRDAVILAGILRTAAGRAAIDVEQLGQTYISMRAKDQERAQAFSNNLVEIFAHELQSLRIGRKFGLMFAEFVPGLKNKIIAQGLGIWM